MRRTLASLLVAAALVAVAGCPGQNPPAPAPLPGTPPSPPPVGGPATPPGPEAPPPVGDPAKKGATEAVIPDEVGKLLPPMLQSAAVWPDVQGLDALPPPGDPKRPKAVLVERLKDDVTRILAPGLRPADFDKAAGLDAAGKAFCRVGKDTAKAPGTGLATVELGPRPGMVFSVTLTWREPVAGLGVEKLTELVKKAVVKDLGDELEREGHRIQPNPSVGGKDDWAGLAILDENGFGVEFGYLYVYARPTRLVLMLQRREHGMAPK